MLDINISGTIFARDREFTFDSFTRNGTKQLEVWYTNNRKDTFELGIFKSLDEVVEAIKNSDFKEQKIKVDIPVKGCYTLVY